MDGCLLSLWESLVNRRREENPLKKNIDNILELLKADDEETWMLAFSLALEILPENILNYCISDRDNHYVTDYYKFLKNPLTLKDVLELGLKHKEIEPVRKHTYSFIWGTNLTVSYILYKNR